MCCARLGAGLTIRMQPNLHLGLGSMCVCSLLPPSAPCSRLSFIPTTTLPCTAALAPPAPHPAPCRRRRRPTSIFLVTDLLRCRQQPPAHLHGSRATKSPVSPPHARSRRVHGVVLLHSPHPPSPPTAGIAPASTLASSSAHPTAPHGHLCGQTCSPRRQFVAPQRLYVSWPNGRRSSDWQSGAV